MASTPPKPIKNFRKVYIENGRIDPVNLEWKDVTELREKYPKDLREQYIYAIKNDILDKLDIKIITSDSIKIDEAEPKNDEDYNAFREKRFKYYRDNMEPRTFDAVKDQLQREILYDYNHSNKTENEEH